MSDNQKYHDIVKASFDRMQANGQKIYSSSIYGDLLWEMYLGFFPEGTNPIYRKRSEHDCGICRHFVKNIAGAVQITEHNKLATIFQDAAQLAPYPYNVVAQKMHDALNGSEFAHLPADQIYYGGIDGPFLLSPRHTAGQRESRTLNKETGKVETYHHLHAALGRSVMSVERDTVRGAASTAKDVLMRSLTEIKLHAAMEVKALIEGGHLYRGEENLHLVQAWIDAKKAFEQAGSDSPADMFYERHRIAWKFSSTTPAAKLKNSAIGDLVHRISEGEDEEKSIAAFERMVAPQNYKRTSAPVTAGMVNKALQKVAELGLDRALERRHAKLGDVSVSDVLWIDGTAREAMKGGTLAGKLMRQVKTQEPDKEAATEISIDDFIRDVAVEASSMQALFEAKHTGNLASITAPVHEDAAKLFKWDNGFAWSYAGNVADSIKERVRKAGGNVDNAQLRISLSWHNTDDLDLHVQTVVNGRGFEHINFANKYGMKTNGKLDVDMNVSMAVRNAVENVSYERAQDGHYKVFVHNYRKRESIDTGFTVEIELNGKVTTISSKKSPAESRTLQSCDVVEFVIKNGEFGSPDNMVKLAPGMEMQALQSQRWGLTTGQFADVNCIMHSPNFWGDNASGNRHTFFVLHEAKSDEATRGLYNEFLRSDLAEHRKVFEMIADTTKCAPADDQLSGLGFSSTKPDAVLVRVVKANKRRLYNVRFGAAKDGV